MSDKMSITIASDVIRDVMLAELYHGNEQWAEVVDDPAASGLTIRIFPSEQGTGYVFDFEEMLAILQQARARLAPAELADGRSLHHVTAEDRRPDGTAVRP